jgi:hypothetical protein
MKLHFSGQFFEKIPQIPNFIKIRPVGAELFHLSDGRMERRDEVNRRFSQFCETRLPNWFWRSRKRKELSGYCH